MNLGQPGTQSSLPMHCLFPYDDEHTVTDGEQMGKLTSIGLLGMVAVALLGRRAYAAEPGTAEEEVVVTGIRMGVGKSIEDKRNLDVVADVVVAEDVGKFPDHNAAEALQRVTGVQITRDTNEGKFVNVRGLSSEFNYVTLNGQAVTSRFA